jgi:hypothetical protein
VLPLIAPRDRLKLKPKSNGTCTTLPIQYLHTQSEQQGSKTQSYTIDSVRGHGAPPQVPHQGTQVRRIRLG